MPRRSLAALLTPAVVGGTLATRARWPRLWVHRRIGRIQGMRAYHWFPLVGWLAITAAVLGATQYFVNQVLGDLEFWTGTLGVGKPHLHVFTLTGVLIAFVLVVSVRWLTRARERVVVDDFVDFTADDAKAVSGLATLLATELSRLRDLYTSINDTLAVPVAVGVHSHSTGGRDAEPGAFLTVRADDLSDTLAGAVASEAKISVGPLLIPVGNIAAIFGRIARGPRVLGSVHRTESGGGPTLTAQIVGGGDRRTWRVDRSHLSGATPASDKAFLDEMVRQLAIEMFTDLTMRGAVRWPAIRTFTQYLREYRRSMRTPKSRSRFLKDAEERLLEAIAEDEQFDFAYYNLGVIYSQLAQAELSTAQRWDVKPAQKVDPNKVHGSRMEAATIAFKRAIERNRNRWEAYYALAVHYMTRMNRRHEQEGANLKPEDIDRLREVVRLCDLVIAMQPRNAEAYDLRGMAIRRLVQGRYRRERLDARELKDEPDPAARAELAAARRAKLDDLIPENIDAAVASHRTAVRLAWKNLCREERRANASPPTSETALTKREENATAALHNLALAYGMKANQLHGFRRALNNRRADDLFKQAIRLAPRGSAAGSHFERARLLRRRRRLREARDAYRHAAIREPENPLYWAQLARACAEYAIDGQCAAPCVERACRSSLESLAPVWRRALSDVPNRADQRQTRRTFKALREAYEVLATRRWADGGAMLRTAQEIHGLESLGQSLLSGVPTLPGRIAATLRFNAATAATADHQGREPERPVWAAEQIGVALARAYVTKPNASQADLEQALRVLDRLIDFVRDARPAAIEVHELEIRKANVLRLLGRLQEALECGSSGLMRDPLSENGRAELAETHMHLWQYDEALAAWDHTLWLKPNDPYVHFQLGLCHWWRARGCRNRRGARESFAQAAELMDQAYQLFSREDVHARCWVRLWRGRLALELGVIDQAIMHLRSAKSYKACAAPARALLGEALLASDEFALARRELEAALKAFPKTADGGPVAHSHVIDADWGESLSAAHLRARCRRGIAAALVEQGEPDKALREICKAFAAVKKIDAEEDQARMKAQCLDTEALAIMAQMGENLTPAGIATATKRLADAIALYPSPDAYLHMARLHELAWERQPNPIERRRLLAEVLAFKDEIEELAGEDGIGRDVAAIADRLDDTYFAVPATHSNGSSG